MKLTAKQAAVLNFIRQRIAAGLPPTVREVSDFMGCAANAGQQMLNRLEVKGLLVRERGKARAMRVVEQEGI